MTSQEILEIMRRLRIGENPANSAELQIRLLAEIAYQLAIMNEGGASVQSFPLTSRQKAP